MQEGEGEQSTAVSCALSRPFLTPEQSLFLPSPCHCCSDGCAQKGQVALLEGSAGPCFLQPAVQKRIFRKLPSLTIPEALWPSNSSQQKCSVLGPEPLHSSGCNAPMGPGLDSPHPAPVSSLVPAHVSQNSLSCLIP